MKTFFDIVNAVMNGSRVGFKPCNDGECFHCEVMSLTIHCKP